MSISLPAATEPKPSAKSAGTLTGVILLTVLIVSAAAILLLNANQLTAGAESGRELSEWQPDVSIDRFDPALAYLPKDAMLGFVLVPGGEFTMGSDPRVDRNAYVNERWSTLQNQGQVAVPAYYISRYEVTVAQFGAFAAATGHRTDPAALQGAPEAPVTRVAWTDALAYCHWLEKKLRTSDATPPEIAGLLENGWTITLPSEAQWEKAARGSDGRIYPWGNQINRAYANFSARGVRPVGSFACADCNLGLADMSGNVWELTRSPFKNYPFDPDLSHLDLREDALWVMRGGSFQDGPNNIRAATRGGVGPGVRNGTIGFRLVLSRVGD